jgi:hypothetical protein
MRLFKQTRPGDWSDVIERVARALEAQRIRVTRELQITAPDPFAIG